MTPEEQKEVQEFKTAIDKLKWSRDQLQIVRMDPIDCEALIREMYNMQKRIEVEKKKPTGPQVVLALLNFVLIGLIIYKIWTHK